MYGAGHSMRPRGTDNSSEGQIVAMTDNSVCDQCGRPRVGRLVQRRLGRDEAPTFVVCVCDATQNQRDLVGSVAVLDQLVRGYSAVESRVLTPFAPGAATSASSESGEVVPIPTDDVSTCSDETVAWTAVSEARESASKDRDAAASRLRSAVAHGSCMFMRFDASEIPIAHEYEIRVEGGLSKCMFERHDIEVTESVEVGFPATLVIDGSTLSVRVRVRSDEGATAKATVRSEFVCPGMTLCSSLEADVSAECSHMTSRPDTCSQGYRIKVRSKTVDSAMWKLRLSHYPATGKYSAELEFPSQERPSPAHVSAGIEWLHTFWGHVDSLSRYIPESLISSCRIASTSVVDIARPPEGKCIYRVKADGELRWLVKRGTVIYCCIPDRRLSVVSWSVLKHPMRAQDSDVVIMRAEQLASGQCVLIDVLSEGGEAASASRKHVPGKVLSRVISPAMTLVREEFSTLEEAEEDRKVCGFPTDGVLAIEVATSMTYRIKRPTIDMQASRGLLNVMAGDLVVPRPKAMPWMEDGRVYEMAVTKGGRGLTFTASCPRPDKQHPNRADVANNIITSVLGDGDEALMTGRFVTMLSFAVRSKVYEHAINKLRGGRLVIDVGSGRMQSKDIMAKHSASWLLCDPGLDTSTLRRKTIDITDMDGMSIVASMKNANMRDGKYLAYKSTFESLIAKPEVSQFIRAQRVPVVYCFSLSYAIGQFMQLLSWAVPQVGCSFVYDGHDSEGWVFNLPGARMRATDVKRRVGQYSFGSDPWVSEPMLLTRSFMDRARVLEVEQMELPDIVIPARMQQMVHHLVMVSS